MTATRSDKMNACTYQALILLYLWNKVCDLSSIGHKSLLKLLYPMQLFQSLQLMLFSAKIVINLPLHHHSLESNAQTLKKMTKEQ